MSAVEKKAVPELRFPEFEGEWKEKHGRDLFINSRAKGENGLPIYSVTLNDGLVPRDSLARHMAADAAPNISLRAKPGDLVYNMMRMWQGAVGRAEVECMVSPAYVVLAPKKNTDSKYFNYALQRARSLYDLWAYSYGLTNDRLRLYPKDFGLIPFAVPEHTEQEKIAAFLGALDEKLSALRRKRELLQEYKRGMMQKIFSFEPRFKRDDGSDFSDWEEKRLGEIGTTVSGLSGKSAGDFGDGKPFVTYKQVFAKSYIDLSKCECVRIEKNENQNRLKKGDVLFTTSSEIPSEVGFASVLIGEVDELYLNSFCFALRPNSIKELIPTFSQYLFRSPVYRKAVFVLSQGSTRFNLAKKSFLKLSLLIPDPDEQQKIADFLSTIDAKINAVAKQIEQVDLFKKGLLQKMFV